MLSLAGIFILEKEVPGAPSTLMRNGEVKLPASFIDDITIGWLWVFLTKKARTVEPTVVNTVSNKMESAEKESLAEESVSTLSFLQEKKTALHKQSNNAIGRTEYDFLGNKVTLSVADTNGDKDTLVYGCQDFFLRFISSLILDALS
jgi:hypothetical protein